MFEQRLRLLVVTFAVALLVIIGRLVQLQVVDAAYYARRAEQSLQRRPRSIPFVRGSIVDRTGEVLVRDEPCWDIAVDYEIIAAAVGDDAKVMRNEAQRWHRRGRYLDALAPSEAEEAFAADLAAMWDDATGFLPVASTSGVTELRRRARRIYDQVARVRRAVAARRGFDAPVAEERRTHAIISGLGAADQIVARELFSRYPWVQVKPSMHRRFGDDVTPFAHILGRLARVDATHVRDDPNADDPFARYLPDERVGVSGVEWSAERLLRGRRGQIGIDPSGTIIDSDHIPPEDGRDVELTVHAGLQRRLYQVIGAAVDAVPASSGGAIVVLDVRSREVLALVSYPSYPPDLFSEIYSGLRDDTRRLPLRFRAVANRYAPGSTIKPLACLAGLMSGAITLEHREHCSGYLFPDVRNRWRCWQVHGTDQRKAHGAVDVVDALTGSCNVFMYRLGEKLGVDRFCSVLDMVGVGKYSGVGLREESKGINPTPSWLMSQKNIRATAGTARLFAIGQGELSMTPIQVANLMATYASGRYRRVKLVRSETPTPEWIIPASEEQWRSIRTGIYRVVNDPRGTAYPYVQFSHDDWVLCAKTGSATAHPWPTAYSVPFRDEYGVDDVAFVRVGTKRAAIDRFVAEHPGATFDPSQVEVAERWPLHPAMDGQHHSHAWVAGYLQARDSSGQPDWSKEPSLAFAILVEFGGSGGRTAGPLAGAVARTLLDVFGSALEIDSVATAQTSR